MKKIVIITSTRADYSILKNLIFNFKKNKKMSLELIISGTHLNKKYGNTIKEIDDLKSIKHKKIDINVKSSSEVDISKTFSLCVKKFTNYLKKNKTDLVILLGDRYEILAFAVSCLISRIPIAHIHGGEVTQNVIDDSIRHSITKMSQIHFVANESYKKRVAQLGEESSRIFKVGGLGAYNLSKEKFLSKKDVLKKIGIPHLNKYILICFHPETLNKNTTLKKFKKVLNALRYFKDQFFLFTMPNADQESDYIYFEIKKFISNFPNSKLIKSLGNKYYYSFLKHSELLIGNSSSGVLEAPSAKVPSLNIGNRQTGRVMAKSVINCDFNEKNIRKKINYLLKMKKKLSYKNPYYNGNTPLKIIKILENLNFNNLINKKFKDI
mgnify:CR=1 FL=1